MIAQLNCFTFGYYFCEYTNLKDTTGQSATPPPPTLRPAFRDFLGVFLNLYYDYMCSEADFTQETFSSNPQFPPSAALLSQMVR